ncbi:MAG: MarR family transcriptional regulator [Helicobacteraceae bacterium]|jgi:DNA-binding MarR family transcriptional regulator|nr:MarR family transcriptional regulator [Helicobacteraceae bacterium]
MDYIEDLVRQLERNHEIMHEAVKLIHLFFSKKEHRQFHILEELNESGRTRLKDLSKRMDLSASSICIMLGQMEAEGLVIREIDAKDRRGAYYSTSQKGKEKIKDVIGRVRRYIINFFEPMDRSDLKKVYEATKVVNQILEKYINKSKGEKL